MGSCISKCKPQKKLKEEISHVQDKLVISQDNNNNNKPISSIPSKMTSMPSEKFKHLSPAPSSSSLSCSTDNSKFITPSSSMMSSSSSSASSSSCSSSLLSSKDRSFSSEFLRSCVKDNPHIISLNPKAINQKDQETPFVSAHKTQKYYPPSPLLAASPLVKTKQCSTQEKVTMNNAPTPKKRARASSPTLVRQKSFRKEQNYNPMLPNRALLRSPSPSRRFNNGTSHENNSYRRQIVSKGNNVVHSCPRRESFRASTASPNRDLTMGRNFSSRKRDTFISQQVSGKINDDRAAVIGDIKCRQDMDIVMEDVNNPLIALDCFIFL